MFQLLKNPNFDFMGKRKLFLTVSSIAVVASIAVLSIHGLNLGIEFTGGAEVELRLRNTPDLGEIRSALTAADLGSLQVTTIGPAEDNDILIRVGNSSESSDGESDSKALTSQIVDVVRETVGGAVPVERDLNTINRASLANMLIQGGIAPGAATTSASAILDRRNAADSGIFHSIDEIAAIDGVAPAAVDYLRGAADFGPLAIRKQDYIGPAIGRELVQGALLAIVTSLIFMMVYIWIRFQLQWGFAAVVALAHDTLITLGLFSIFGQEMSQAVVAAFLTLVGYSINDTVVVFDRIRENVAARGTMSFPDVINHSINQTLSRTVITSGLTWVVVVGLLAFGGASLRPFAFVLTVGVLVGTYSSIWVASPFLLVWKQYLESRKTAKGKGSGKNSPPSRLARPAS